MILTSWCCLALSILSFMASSYCINHQRCMLQESLKTILLYASLFLTFFLNVTWYVGCDHSGSEVKILKDMMTSGSVRVLPSPAGFFFFFFFFFFSCILTKLLFPTKGFLLLLLSQVYNFMHAISLLFLLNFLCLFLIYLCQNKGYVLFSCFLQLVAFAVCSFGFVFFISWTLQLQKLAPFSLAHLQKRICELSF